MARSSLWVLSPFMALGDLTVLPIRGREIVRMPKVLDHVRTGRNFTERRFVQDVVKMRQEELDGVPLGACVDPGLRQTTDRVCLVGVGALVVLLFSQRLFGLICKQELVVAALFERLAVHPDVPVILTAWNARG